MWTAIWRQKNSGTFKPYKYAIWSNRPLTRRFHYFFKPYLANRPFKKDWFIFSSLTSQGNTRSDNYWKTSSLPSIGIICAPTVSTTDCTQRRKHCSNTFGSMRSNTRRNVSGQGIPEGKAKNCFNQSYLHESIIFPVLPSLASRASPIVLQSLKYLWADERGFLRHGDLLSREKLIPSVRWVQLHWL